VGILEVFVVIVELADFNGVFAMTRYLMTILVTAAVLFSLGCGDDDALSSVELHDGPDECGKCDENQTETSADAAGEVEITSSEDSPSIEDYLGNGFQTPLHEQAEWVRCWVDSDAGEKDALVCSMADVPLGSVHPLVPTRVEVTTLLIGPHRYLPRVTLTPGDENIVVGEFEAEDYPIQSTLVLHLEHPDFVMGIDEDWLETSYRIESPDDYSVDSPLRFTQPFDIWKVYIINVSSDVEWYAWAAQQTVHLSPYWVWVRTFEGHHRQSEWLSNEMVLRDGGGLFTYGWLAAPPSGVLEGVSYTPEVPRGLPAPIDGPGYFVATMTEFNRVDRETFGRLLREEEEANHGR